MATISHTLRQLLSSLLANFRQRGPIGKIAMGAVGLLLSCCMCSIPLVVFTPDATPTPETVAGDEIPTLAATSEPVATNTIAPTDTATAEPTDTPEPTDTAESTDEATPTSPPESTDAADGGNADSASDTSTPRPSATPAATQPPALTNTPQPTETASPAIPGGHQAQVVNVVDGDTIDVSINGQVQRLRYIGMDTPARGDPYFDEATAANASLVSGQTVYLVKDVSETDQYGRLLRYIYLAGGTFVNAELVRQGYAQAATFPPDVRHESLFPELQAEARSAGRGLWSAPQATATSPPPAPTNTAAPQVTSPLPTRPPPTATSAPQGNCDPAYPDVCIPPPPPDLDCDEISYRNFTVLAPNPHRFDGDNDGNGCEG